MLIDVARGFAIVLMIAYHFTFDVNLFARLGIDFDHDPRWLAFRTLIVSLFLLLVGVSQSLGHQHGFSRTRFLRRLAQLAACAALVTLGSWIMFPATYIFFGILHFIAVAGVLGLLTVRFYSLNLVSGGLLILLGTQFAHEWFDHPALQWIGLMTHKPFTEDYVPLLPWFGVVQIGQYLGQAMFRVPAGALLRAWSSPAPAFRLLSLGGRYSLLIYMVHQPVLIGLLYLYFGL
ncbi:MAG: DUF1624 domain-containing protein [Gammaproteobacteria bacterium]|nr:DUF1624 domain-containing protein [Gammaproteobacteria bacterium]